jgi:hypothetical protein
MNGDPRPRLNLATHPLLNRRLYRTAFGGLVVLFLVLGGWAGRLWVKSAAQSRADEKTAAELELRIQAAEKDRAEKTIQTEVMKKKNGDLFTEVNAVIDRKNFSWVDFFARIEEALPPNCSITSMNPLQLSGTRVQAAFKVVTPGLSAVLKLIENLSARKFKDISMTKELSGGGRLICEIGLVYDGPR